MNIDNKFAQIEEQLEDKRNFISDNSDSTENLRSVQEAKQILVTLQKITNKLQVTFSDTPSLEGVFEKHYGKYTSFLSDDKIINVCLENEFLFPRAKEYPLNTGIDLSPELIENYGISFIEWVDEISAQHASSQDMIFKTFDIELKQSSLNCHCQKCSADFRAILRDTVFKEQKAIIDKSVAALEDLIIEKDISYVSDYISKLKKHIERNLGKIRYKLKRGSLNKLDSDIKSYYKLHLGHNSPMSAVYRERLSAFFNGLLAEDGLSTDLINTGEYERFFSQLGAGIWKAPHALKRDFRKLVKTVLAFKRKDISATILKEYLGEFWIHSVARRKKRKIIYHMGPTNSGKTYNAIQALSKAKTGCYLAPLRLLASELFDTLNDLECKTNLLTGEEVIEVDGATHYSSTIEMARLNEEFECVVIDEIQMISDSQRGWAWTRALVNINADEVHLCGDHSVLDLVKQILELTGDVLEINEYTRMTNLTVMKNHIRLVDLEKNDALIVFSRRNALKYKRDLENLNFKVSIVYGRLSPEVRREQARKFDSGETDIIVATDAIAMGMNLPIKRIVFSAIVKFFDGKEFPLTDSELKQIAGRAGRFKRFPEGYVTTLQKVEDGPASVEIAINNELVQKEFAMVGPDLDIFRSVNIALEESNLKTLSLSEFLRLFNTMTFQAPFYCVELKEMIELAEMVEDADSMESLSDAEIFGFACAPVNQGLMDHVQYYLAILTNYVGKNSIINEEINSESDDIDYLETAIKCVELYQWLARHFDNQYFEFSLEDLIQNKGLAIEKLNQMLSEKVTAKCSSCSAKLDDDHKYNICETCFSARRSGRRGGGYQGRGSGARRSSAGDKKPGDRKPGDRKQSDRKSSGKPSSARPTRSSADSFKKAGKKPFNKNKKPSDSFNKG